MGRQRRARRGEPADPAGRAEGSPDDPRRQGLRARQGARRVDPEIGSALLQPEPRPHLRTQRPQPAARQRRDGVHRARPDRHSVRRPGAPGAGGPSVQLRRERRGGGAHRLHQVGRGKDRRAVHARRDARHRGAESRGHTAATYQITVADLEEAMKRERVDFGAGDTVLVRTGWGRHFGVDNALFMSGEPGIGIAAAEFLAKRNIMMVGSDNWAVEIRPYPDKGLFLPVHGFMLVVNGIFLLENLDLEAMSRDKVYEFALIVQPLKLKGGTGSTVAPIAVR